MTGDAQGNVDFYTPSLRVHLQENGGGISQVDIADVPVADPLQPVWNVQTIAFSATPVFDTASSTIFQMTLTGAVSSSTVLNSVIGRVIQFKIKQGAGGPWSFVWPVSFLDTPSVVSVGVGNTLEAEFWFDGVNWNLLGAPGSGMVGVIPSTAGANQFAIGINNFGVIQYGQPILSNVGPGSTGAGAYSFSSATSFTIPNAAGASVTAGGSIAYDTTNKNTHIGGNGVDNISVLVPSASVPTNGDCAKWSLVGGVLTLLDGGNGACIGTTPPGNAVQTINGPVNFNGFGLSGIRTLNGNPRFALGDGWVCDGITDDTVAFVSSLNALNGANGGTLVLPALTCLIAGQVTLPNDGASPLPHQKTIRIIGAGGGGLTQQFGANTNSCNGGSVLNMTFNSSTAKIDTRGLGMLEIANVCFKDTNTDGKPFLFTTNTIVKVHHNQFYGNSTASPKQDAIILGGLGTNSDGTATAIFQGYGTTIADNQADQVGRFVLCQNQCNAVQIVNNHVFINSANSLGGAIELNPGAGATEASGNYIAGNLIEVYNYKYGVNLVQNSIFNTIVHNSCFDSSVTTLNCVRIASAAGNGDNQVVDANPDKYNGVGPSPSSVTTADSLQTSGLFMGATGSATNPTFSWSGFGSNPPGFYRIGGAFGVAGSGVAQEGFNIDQNGQFRLRSDGHLDFSSTTDPIAGAVDTALCRSSANVINISTQGSGACNANGTAGLTILSITATAFASLGTPANGTVKYCNDCTIANPCAGAGNGALAKRLNGVWVCN